MSYFDNFLTAKLLMWRYMETSVFRIKPKTQVAIVTCMDSRLSSRGAGTRSGSWRCPYFAECWRARDRGHDPLLGHLSAADGYP